MGHRHPFTAAAQMFEGEDDHTWNHMHMERPYMNLAQNGFFNPIESTNVDAVPFSSHWNPALMSNMYNSLSHNEVSHHQPNPPGSSYNPFVHLPPGGAFCMVPEDYVHHASSSNVDQQTFHGAEGSFVDLTMGNGRVPHKRKSPGIPDTRERGSRNGCYSAGSSSNHNLSSEWQSWTPNLDSQQMPREHISMNPSYRGNGLSVRSDCSMRNVRSRPALDLESNHAGTYLSSIPPPSSYPTNCPNDYSSSSLDFFGETSSTLTRDLSQVSSVHGRNLVSDTGGNHETNHFHLGDSASNPSPEIGGYHHDYVLGRHAINSQSFNGASTNSVRGVRSSYSQRSGPALRPSSSGLRLGHVAPSDEGLQLFAERYSAGHSRPLPSIPWHGSDRIGRSRASNERYRLLSDETSLRDQLSSEKFAGVYDCGAISLVRVQKCI
ncbi:uncharacterized protein LOC120013145 isoform X2 [Tripterygium wilfordii]|uniref:uncharacterized protein LOC120013145 isoform X2 n=1 Tax=Tripterygium wilfordii TaxID=458696 RepID=UPI0018F81619|nr:uncharacterized protein LOC120013145 isoform X2 [Tripterygium wilfordii]